MTMTTFIELLPHFDVSGGVLMGLLDATLKATLILALAAILVVALRRAAARQRHAMLAVAVFSVLVVPILSVVMPRYHVPLLPGPITDKPALNVIDSTQYSNNPISSSLPTAPLADSHSIGDLSMTVASTDKLASELTPAIQPPTLTALSNTHAVSEAIQADTKLTSKPSATLTSGVSISLVLVIVWAIGLLAGLLWMMLGTMRVSRWMRLGAIVDDMNARRVMRQVTQGLGLRRQVALIETDAIDSPITWGAMRPVVLLPKSWHEWTTERLRIVLLHELMHVRRNDWLVQMVARLACVVHWFNPLVWFVSRRLEEIRELACDDDVVDIGTRPSTYAQTLLEMATRMRRRPMIAAVALNMAARTRLEGRVVSILGHSRDGARRGLVLQGALVGLAACALILSAVEPWQVESPRHPASDSARRHVRQEPVPTVNSTDGEIGCIRDVSSARPTRFASAVGAWRVDQSSTPLKSADRFTNSLNAEATPVLMTPVTTPVALVPTNNGGSSVKSESPTGGRLIDRADSDRLLLWQQAVAKYREIERVVRLAVLDNEFEAALGDTDRAIRLIESARPFATDAIAFHDTMSAATGLREFVADESRRFNDEQNRILQAEIEAHVTGKLDAIKSSKAHIVAQLANRADELAKAKRYDEAVQVLDQLLLVEPENEGALWQRGILNDLRQAVSARGAVGARHNQTRDLMIANDWDGVPYHDDLRYPADWPEKTSRRRSSDELREPESTRRARQRLRTAAPEIQFDAMAFEDVIDRLRAMTGLNIVPNWAALEAVAIEKDAEVSLQLRDVSYEKTLDLILSEVSGGEVDLAYEIDEGIIRISTKEDLSRRTKSVAIDVRDLLISVPTFRGPTIDISQIGQSGQQAGGLGGGKFIEGGGGGSGGGQGQNPFQDGQNDDEDVDTNDALQPLIDLIQATIEPESWREAGGNVGSISTLNQMIVVTQTSTAQQQLQDL